MARKLAASRRKDEAFSDLLGWAVLFDSGSVIMRGGNVLVAYYMDPPDSSGFPSEFRQQVSVQVNAALARLGTGWSIWSDVATVPAAFYPPPEASHFPDPVSRAVDEERRRMFLKPGAFMATERVIVFCYTPPGATAHRLADALYRDDAPERRSALRLTVNAMRRTLDRFEDQVGGLLKLRRMGSYLAPDRTGREHHYDELVNYLAFCAYGRLVPLVIPDSGAFLDNVIGGEDFHPGHTPLLGEDYIAVITSENFAAQSLPEMLARLFALGIPCRVSQRFIFRDGHDAEKDIKTHRWQWKLAEVPFLGKAIGLQNLPVNEDAVNMRQGCDVALSLAREGKVSFGYYNLAVVLRHASPAELMEQARAAVRAIEQSGYKARIETENAPDALLATFPGHVEENVRRPMIHTANLADLMPLSGTWKGSQATPNPLYPQGAPALLQGAMDGNELAFVNLCVGDNANFGFFGPPGTGKTTLLNATALQALRYRGMRVRAVDHKRGMLVACRAAGGNYHEIGGDGAPPFAPFAHLETGEDLRRAEDWVRSVWPLHMPGPFEPSHRDAVRDALLHLQGQPGRRSMTNFHVAVQNVQVRDVAGYYCHGLGAGGDLFDGEGAELPRSHWDTWDITAIIEAGDTILLPALLCLMQQWEREETGAPMLQLIDEAWKACQHPVWRPHLERQLKTKRSKNVGIGLATQNLTDIASSRLAALFMENVPTRIYGPNPAAQTGGADGPADLYKQFGLTWTQRETIRTATPKRQYYLTQNEDSRLIQFGLGPLTLALAGATGEGEVLRARALMAQHGDGWLGHHLQEKGITDHARSLGL